MPESTRTESDPLGEIQVPETALWGAQTQRAIENFAVSGQRIPMGVIHAIARIKKAAATANAEKGRLPVALRDLIGRAADEVLRGDHDHQFPVDVFQTGSGTSSHMNVNEVIANRANQLAGGRLGGKSPVHPNDHVNLGQSSNDVFPTASHLAALALVRDELLPALHGLEAALRDRARAFDGVVKIGRTHLQDALPIRLGQEMAGYASLVGKAATRAEQASHALLELPLGGTGVGTGFGAAPGFATTVIARLAQETGFPLVQAADLREALSARDGLVELSAALRGAAVSLTKVANDLRWLASGPRGGIGEIRLPSLQPGSSLMPGKVNPVLPEMLLMVAADVIGSDATVAWAGAAGNFELNAMMPIIIYRVISAGESLARSIRLFTSRCVEGIVADEARCAALVEQSLALATALLPKLGYDAAAAVAKAAASTGKTIREICLERKIATAAELDELLDARKMTEPAG
jgi:fumarate hydratase class II